jgi:hypothetical protein
MTHSTNVDFPEEFILSPEFPKVWHFVGPFMDDGVQYSHMSIGWILILPVIRKRQKSRSDRAKLCANQD